MKPDEFAGKPMAPGVQAVIAFMSRSIQHPATSLALSRRAFLRRAALASTFSLVPAHVLGRAGTPSPNRKLNVALIGVGGRGVTNLEAVQTENIVALCDVDQERCAKAIAAHPGTRFFSDYRVLLDRMHREIDAVVVSTPDHTHAPAVLRAIALGKHVFCEKPLAHSLQDTRQITQAARHAKVATQLGNQGHSSESIRQFVEMIHDGAIGTVREVHAWCQNSYRPRGYTVRPQETPPVPESLDWDLWLGPAAERPYHPSYLPGRWRGWVDFGTGIIGDWTCHVVDPVFWAFQLGSPTRIVAHAEEYEDPRVRAETYPRAARFQFDFPARGDQPPVRLHWYSGCQPERPEELEPNRNLPGIGAIVVGDQGKIMYGSHGAAGAQLIPAERNNAYHRPDRTLPRSAGHHEDWIAACKGGPAASAHFDYGGPLTEIALLGVLALRFQGQPLEWNSQSLRVTNLPEANLHIAPPRREGWYPS
jgi:predicted dehydrogenase